MTSEVHKNNLDGTEEIVSEKNSFQRSKMERRGISGEGTNVTKFQREDQGRLDLHEAIWHLYRDSTDITMMHFIKPSLCLFLS